ncbi:MAG: HAD hydrolase-like protein [Planctomycetes bacterium]|nr:HAD hydrolase-like protein [Planctomycetota bacterium]
MPTPILFDAVIFDLDGTLVATGGFWVAAARAGARRAFDELGLDRELPGAEAWLSMVGFPLAVGFERVFPDLTPAQRALVMERCVEEEERAVRGGQAALMPGARDALIELKRRGLRLGIASNCAQGYLTRMQEELELGKLVDAARCLDSPRVHTKSDMVRDLLELFGTRSAVMVGDRSPDSEAAHANGLPHVHLAQGLAAKDEAIEFEASLDDLAGLIPLLERRATWIESALFRARVLDASGRRLTAATLGITGRAAAGKSLFARDVARLLRARGLACSVVALDDYLVGASAEADSAPLAHVQAAFDLDGLIDNVIQPHRRGEPVVTRAGEVLPGDGLLVVQGLFLMHPRLRAALERVIALEADETLLLRRLAAREASPELLMRARRTFLPLQRAFDEAFPPAQRADLVLPAENPLGEPGA